MLQIEMTHVTIYKMSHVSFFFQVTIYKMSHGTGRVTIYRMSRFTTFFTGVMSQFTERVMSQFFSWIGHVTIDSWVSANGHSQLKNESRHNLFPTILFSFVWMSRVQAVDNQLSPFPEWVMSQSVPHDFFLFCLNESCIRSWRTSHVTFRFPQFFFFWLSESCICSWFSAMPILRMSHVTICSPRFFFSPVWTSRVFAFDTL